MKEKETKNENRESQNKIFTIPNAMSAFRLCLIPVIIWLYCSKHNYLWTTVVLVISGLTDLADGFVARHFNMVSNLGKILDPVADKLTQGVMVLCLSTRFPLMFVLLILFIFKEVFVGITELLVIRRTGKVIGAEWHGKIVTFLLYAMAILHVIWYDIPVTVSDICLWVCIAIMVLSLILYGYSNIRLLSKSRKKG